MNRVREAARRHPRWVDAGLALLLALVGLPATAEQRPGVVSWLCYGLFFLPLVWRRRAPLAVFWAVAAFLWVQDIAGLDLAGAVVALPVVIYTVARHRPRRQLWPVAIATEASLVAAWILDNQPWPNLVPVNAVLAAAALLGTNISTRRAYLAELEERARRLERERDQQAQLATAAERARIAREMHDIVAHNLAVIVSLADAAALTATTAPRGAADKMQKVAATGREALREMRRLLGVLNTDQEETAGLVPQPGFDDIDRLIDQVRAAGLHVTLTRKGVPGRWGPGAGLTVYRIVQEALTNTMKHAGPKASTHVRLCYTPTGAEVEITNDGLVTSAEPPEPGHGLAGMAQRTESYGGRFEAGPLPSGGWRVRATLPLSEGVTA